jgi:hypothetical protein
VIDGGSITEKVRLTYLLAKFSAGRERLIPGSSMNPDGKRDPVEIFTNIGIVCNPILTSLGIRILNDAGLIPEEDSFNVSLLVCSILISEESLTGINETESGSIPELETS